jgi:hypothetical protein
MFAINSILEFWSTAYGKAIYSILAGTVGVVVLTAFLNMLVPPAASLKFLPFIVAFNTALTGYMVLEKTRTYFNRKWSVAVFAGVVATLLAFFALNTFFLHTTGISLIGLNELLLMGIIGLGSSWFGGVLAINYLDLN